MNPTLDKALLQHFVQSDSDDNFIGKVNELYATEGKDVFRAALKLLTGIDFSPDSCRDHWLKAQEHRLLLMEKLGRNVDLTTALSDYLSTSTNFLDHPRLVEAGLYESIVYETIHDKLTGLFNRPYFDEVYRRQVSSAQRYRNDFAVLFLDIDNFKDINDMYGHLAGDEALKQIAAVIQRQKRDSDVAARYGGEEFVLLLIHTDNVSAYSIGERIRKEVEKLEIHHGDQYLKLTISGGIASFPFSTEDPAQLLQMADNAVYLAKGAGKNRISHFKRENRRYLRVKIDQQILVKELDSHNAQSYAGKGKNIGIGGILFDLDQPLPLGALITVKVPVVGRDPLVLIGKVSRVDLLSNGRYDIGMTTSFKEMDKIAVSEIGSILRKKSAS